MENNIELVYYVNEAINQIKKKYQGELTIENILYTTQGILNELSIEKSNLREELWNNLIKVQNLIGNSQI